MTGSVADVKLTQRRYKKHMVEKRRRHRINFALEQLKAIVLIDLGKDPAKYDKMEKADILDLTVQYMSKVAGASIAPVSSTRVVSRPVHPAMVGGRPTTLVLPPSERNQSFSCHLMTYQPPSPSMTPPSPPMTPPSPSMTPPSPAMTPPASPVSFPLSPISPRSPGSLPVTPPASPTKEGRRTPSLSHLPPKMRVKNIAATSPVWRPF